VGSEKRAFIIKELDPPTIALMRKVKQVFDPADVLNPGKLFP
jgi:D-lactate dehydrogenase